MSFGWGGRAIGTPLEPGPEEMRAMARAVAEYLVGFVAARGEAPAADLEGAEDLAASLREDVAPEGPAELGDLLRVVDRAAAKAFDTTGPGYLAYIPGGGLYAAAVADFLACGINRYVGMWQPAPALAQLEWNVIRWLAGLFGYPGEARGILTSGGSMANFSALVTARAALLGEDPAAGVLYVSDETHASVPKAAALAGLPRAAIRTVPVTGDLRMDVDALRALVEEDRDAGRIPFCVVASAGTVNTGAVDPIAEVGAVAREAGMWLHVDGAYGGFFQLTERGRARFRGIEAADSVALDPHKGMFLPYGTGCLLVRDGERLRRAHSVAEAGYLQDLATEGESLNFADYSPELSRDFRGLRVWLPIKLHGLGAFRAALDEKLDLARLLYEALAATPGFEVPWAPDLSVVAFRYRPRAGDVDAFNRRLLARINASQRVFLSSTTLPDGLWLRAAILSHRTHRDRVEEAVEIIRGAARELDG